MSQTLPGWWAKFSRYEIVNGYIRPAADASLEPYQLDPGLREAGGQRPYETLAQVMRNVRARFEVRTVIHVAGELPLHRLLTPKESDDARTAGRLHRAVQALEEARADKALPVVPPPPRPRRAGGAAPALPDTLTRGRRHDPVSVVAAPHGPRLDPVGHRAAQATGYVLTPESETQVLQWCRRFGLLGVLLQRVETVVFPPRPVASDGPRSAGVIRTRLLRTPVGWQLKSEENVGEPFPAEVEHESGVMGHPLSSFEITREPFTPTWTKFFPSIPSDQQETYPYPHPREDAFFWLYSEPIDEFLRAAGELIGALETVAWSKAQDRPDFGPLSAFANAIHELNGLAAATRPVSWPQGDGSLRDLWVAPTLLASLARMALQDLTRGNEVRFCANPTCHRLYVSSAYQARYCSEKCRHTVNKRAFRRNRRTNKTKETAQKRKAVSRRRSE